MKKVKNIIILAGGDSDRFWPLEEKSMVSFLGKSFIENLVANIAGYTEKIIIVINKANKEKMTQLLSPRLNIKLITQKENLDGMGGAVMSCDQQVKGEVIILNASDIFNFKILSRLIDKSRQEKFDFSFIAKEMDNYFPGGYLEFKDNKLSGIVEKPAPDKTPSNLINLVIDYFKDFDQFLVFLKKIKVDKDCWYEEALSAFIRNFNSGYIVYNDYWQALKYSWDVLKMMSIFLSTINKNSVVQTIKISKNTVIIPPVIIEKGVKIGNFAKIVGPCYIDEGTIIGDYSLIRESHIGKNCLIGGYSEVARSYLFDRVSLHRNYVGDSVLGSDVLMGAGAVTANFRFDEKIVKSVIRENKIKTDLIKLGAIIGKRAKIGVNGTLLPGIKIGRGSVIGPGEVVKSDISDNKFIFNK